MSKTIIVGEAQPGETAPRRKAGHKAGTVDKPQGITTYTIPQYFEECVQRNGNTNAMGWRELIEVHTDTKKITKIVNGKETQVDKNWLFYEQSPYKFITYPQVLTLVKNYAKGLSEIGLISHESKLHIFASTSHKWMQTFLAAQFVSVPVVTAYDTLGEAGLIHSLLQTNSNGIFTDNVLLENLVVPLTKAKDIKFIIHGDYIDPNDKRDNYNFYSSAKKAKDKILAERPDIKFYSMDEVIKLGENSSGSVVYPAKEELCCIMYTSGSTGDPKGVEITHANIISGLGGVTGSVSRDTVRTNDRVISFLPLAHIFEMMFELTCFWWGGVLGYANVKTLTEISCRNSKSDLQEFKPTIMVGVAAVWESVRKGVLAKVKQQPALNQRIFWTAFAAKKSLNSFHLPGGMFDFVFKKVKEATGGHLRMVMNGGSAISKDAHVFISTLIAPMLLGYGLTETCANTTLMGMDTKNFDTVGPLVGSVTCKLLDVEDAGYFAKNNQGEIVLKGGPVTRGYYKNEEETRKAFTEDGWFRTGDIGQWTDAGDLQIIDRLKNLVKTLNGEYIALEKLESIYRSNSNVLNLCVYADQNRVKPIALVIPNETAVKQILKEEKVYSDSELKSKTMAHLCDDPKVNAVVLKSILMTGKSQGLKGIELLQNVVLLDDEWTPQNGYVTSAQKLQRKKILQANQELVDKAYSSWVILLFGSDLFIPLKIF